jgi:hypothetical protein
VSRARASRRGGSGRPRLSPDAQRGIRVATRLTLRECGLIAALAAEANLTLSAYLRAAALRAKINPPLVPPINLRFVGDLGRVGNNLNQLVHAIHAGRAAPGLLAVIEELRSLLDDVRRELIGLQSPPHDREGHQGDGVPRDA